jgi:hypothetical protein
MKRLIFPASALTLFLACGSSPVPSAPSPPPPPPPPPPVVADEVFVGAGDVGWCGPDGHPDLTAALLDRIIPGTVFMTGDGAYFSGSSEDYRNCYDPSWGRHKARTRPVPGNHEYETPGAAGYFAYWGAAADPPGGYYSYTLGAWHIVALNSEISAFPGSAQVAWLRADLTANPSRCTLAYFHTPVFGSGANGGNVQMQVVWRELYDSGVDVVVNGHNHSYERFAPQDPDGRFDSARGIREFVAGTGGGLLTGFPQIRANSEVRSSTLGVLKLTLGTNRYDWQFVPVAGASFSDSGSGTCH